MTKPFPLAAFGASAGGIEAMTEILQHLPRQTGIAYVYIQHLDPLVKSNLTNIFKRVTEIPVLEAADQMKVQPDHLYIVPPNAEIELTDGIFLLTERPSSPYANMPINRFFISLAEKYGQSAIGIILSGTATDGTVGVKAIKAEGGITFAQDDSAKFSGMARSAISEGAVDLVLSPKTIAEELAKLGKKSDLYLVPPEEENEPEDVENEDVISILKILERSVGVDFSQYKQTTIRRRIIRRMVLNKMENLKSYLQYFKQHPTEVSLLFQDLLINVTAFFRDRDSIKYLTGNVLPKMVESRHHDEPLRIWVPACSTGQEAYSIAILLMEALGEKAVNTAIQIFATDLSELAINKARLGIYKADEVADVSETRLQRFFTKIDGSYRIIKTIRDLCVFATHNILKDPPFSRLDLISCCNLLIYLEYNLQRKVISAFHYSLNPNGILVLGKSENLGAAANLFTQPEKRYKIYIKKKEALPTLVFKMENWRPETNKKSDARPGFIHMNFDDSNLEIMVDKLLLKKYTPASVVVNSDLDILQFRGSTGLFLEAAPGKASLNLMKMARQGMGFELRNIVHKAKKSGEPARKDGLDITINDRLHKVSFQHSGIRSLEFT